MKPWVKELLGECIGTFILVFLGCGTVAVAVIYQPFHHLIEVAALWGVAVALAIFLTKSYSSSHLNPAVSVGMFVANKINFLQLLGYICSQFLGAFLAAIILYAILQSQIAGFELEHQIVRGEPSSVKTAMMFGEFFPNPGYQGIHISWWTASALEAIGTFILMFVILIISKFHVGFWAPIIIGFTIMILIVFIAPYTQAGFNPARDFGPRLWAYIAGWKNAAFPTGSGSFFSVYILGPIFGSTLAVLTDKLFFIKK